MKFTLRQLEIFVAVAQTGSASRAAERLALSQSATSTALAELEKSYSQVLFDRVGKSLRMNDTGRWLLPHAMEILDRARGLENALGAQTALGPLNLGASLTIGNYLATLFLADFLQQRPDSRVHLTVHNSTDIVAAVARFELDLGLVEGNFQHPDVVVEQWLRDELVVFAAPGHPLAGRQTVSREEVLDCNWILREPGSGTRSAVEHAFGEDRHRLAVRLELEHTEAIKRAVEAGLGLGCISRLALRDAFRRGSLVPINVPDLDLRRSFYIIHHRDKYISGGLALLIGHIRDFTGNATSTDDIVLTPVP
ncbi:MAG: LysR family transcriptional regulator [Candidatus Dactylopiibacterium carminicum]|uniref:LysR family transcriptional regulator n=1 Tax=Candidatus Dactylopiibacterium carminicum TaxID=857335 RepID=A0A272ES98_9RHOO|nr:LysR family transcriptional regulator [Candidatus Dactylopiibacterium carminicum]PAS92957.1 MAG: LysR family transcriptional regulator [Candidatus Dactylopiibacterium carminicum]PAS99023.1 MAG: LysR family transcriptional regulator [Candidatus Dactylopiibacterium carminicum]